MQSVNNPEAEPTFVCECQEEFREACANEGCFGEIDSKRYCVFHFPNNTKAERFNVALRKRMEELRLDFRGFWFSEGTAFQGTRFAERATFRYAVFSEVADFSYAEFTKEADFRGVIFQKGANFHATRFVQDVSFRVVTFETIADFSYASFGSYARFAGDAGYPMFNPRCVLNLQFVRVGKPEHFTFHSVRLQPDWFVNVDVRKFELTNIHWDFDLRREIAALRAIRLPMPHTLLSITYRRLAINAEENQYYPDAAEFRYCSMEVLRWRARYIDGIKHYHRRTVAEKIRSATRVVYLNPLHVGKVVIGGFRWMKGAVQNRRHRAILSVTWWYWLMSGYGEKTIRAASWLFAIVVAFGLLYATRGVIPSSTDRKSVV